MGCPCNEKKTLPNLVFNNTLTVEIPSNCPEPEFLKELEDILLCMTTKKYFVNSSQQEVNVLLGKIGTMRMSGNFCQFSLTNFYNRLKNIQCATA